MPSTPIRSLRAAQVLRFLCTTYAAEGTYFIFHEGAEAFGFDSLKLFLDEHVYCFQQRHETPPHAFH